MSAALNREEPHWLTLLGPSGIGKTHLLRQALALAHSLVRVNIPKQANLVACEATDPDRYDETVGIYNQYVKDIGWPRELSTARVVPSRDLDVWTAPRDFAEFDVVFVEDIAAGEKGAAKVTRDRIAELLQLRSNKFTLIDGNFGGVGDVADHFDGRIASRLTRDKSECIVFPPETPDYSTFDRAENFTPTTP